MCGAVDGVLASSEAFPRPGFLHYCVKMEVFIITPWNLYRKWYLRLFRYKHLCAETNLYGTVTTENLFLCVRSYIISVACQVLQFTSMSWLKISLMSFLAKLFFTEYESFLKQEQFHMDLSRSQWRKFRFILHYALCFKMQKLSVKWCKPCFSFRLRSLFRFSIFIFSSAAVTSLPPIINHLLLLCRLPCLTYLLYTQS